MMSSYNDLAGGGEYCHTWTWFVASLNDSSIIKISVIKWMSYAPSFPWNFSLSIILGGTWKIEQSIFSSLLQQVSLAFEICEEFYSMCRFPHVCYQAWSFCNHRWWWYHSLTAHQHQKGHTVPKQVICNHRMQGFRLLKAITHRQLQCVCKSGDMFSHNELNVLDGFRIVHVFLDGCALLIFMLFPHPHLTVLRTHTARMPWP